MSDSQLYETMRAFIGASVELAVTKATLPLHEEIRSLKTQLETRSAQLPAKGDPGVDGKDGVGISDIYIREGTLVTRLSDGTERILGRVVGEKGDPGKDGEDGKGLPGKDGENGKDSVIPGPKGDPGERGANGIATREELDAWFEERAADLQTRSFADTWRDVWKAGETYKRGDLAQWDGSPWLALRDSKDVKPGTSPDWKLFAKKGRDGRDGPRPYGK